MRMRSRLCYNNDMKYILEAKHYFFIETTYGKEVKILSVDPAYMILKLTDGQVEELNALEIFPSPV